MISSALRVLRDELNQYIQSVDGSTDVVELGHVSHIESLQGVVEGTINQVLLSLVNIEEEKRLKNTGRKIRVGSETQLTNPPITLNLYLLFSASVRPYETALRRLSQVIEFFQGKFVFTIANTTVPGAVDDEKLADLKLIMDIHTLNFEQINDLWGSLGGKQVPFVLYRARLIQLRREAILESGPVIDKINEGSNSL